MSLLFDSPKAYFSKFRTLFFCFALLASMGMAQAALASAVSPTIWKLGTLAPKGMGWANQVQDILSPTLDRITKGQVGLKIYYGGVMGDDELVLERIRSGQLNGAGLSGQGATFTATQWAVVELPFLFSDYDEVDYVKEHMTPVFDRIMESNGYVLLTWIDQDFDRTYSIEKPVIKLDDFSRTRVVSWYGVLEKQLIKRLGGIPVPMDVPDIPENLRRGMAEINIGPAIWMVGSQLHSVVRFVNPLRIRYTPALIVVSTKTWDDLTPEIQQDVKNSRKDVTAEFCQGIRLDNEKFHEAMIRYGVRQVQTTKEEAQQIRNAALPVWQDFSGSLYSPELLNQVLGHLDDFRQAKP